MSILFREVSRVPSNSRPPRHEWYAQPVVWLGIVIFAASLAGCVWMIVLGVTTAEMTSEPPVAGHSILGVPVGSPMPAK